MTPTPDHLPPSATAVGPIDDSLRLELTKIRYQALVQDWLEEQKAKRAADTTAQGLATARQDADRAAETALRLAVHNGYLDGTKAALDRALTRTNYTTLSASGIVTIYTALLGLVYAADPLKGRPLELYSIIPAIFLGLAIVLNMTYSSYLATASSSSPWFLPSGIGGKVAEQRLLSFMLWCRSVTLQRSWALRSAVVSLAVGVLTLPTPFIDWAHISLGNWASLSWAPWAILITGLVLVAGAGKYGDRHAIGG